MSQSVSHQRSYSSTTSFTTVPRSGSVSDMLEIDTKFAPQTKKPVSALGKMSRYYSHQQQSQQHQQYYQQQLQQQQLQQQASTSSYYAQQQQFYQQQQQPPYPLQENGFYQQQPVYQQQPPYPQDQYNQYQQPVPQSQHRSGHSHRRQGQTPHRHSTRSHSKSSRPRPTSQPPSTDPRSINNQTANSSFNDLSTYNQTESTFYQPTAIEPVPEHHQHQHQHPQQQNYSSSSNSSTSLRQKTAKPTITSPFTDATSTSDVDHITKSGDIISEMEFSQKSTPSHQRTQSVVANATPKLPVDDQNVPPPMQVAIPKGKLNSETPKRSESLKRSNTSIQKSKKPGLLKRMFSFKKTPSMSNMRSQKQQQPQPPLPAAGSSAANAAAAAAATTATTTLRNNPDVDIDADQRLDRRQRRASSIFSIKSFSRSRSQSVSAKTSPQKQNRFNNQPPKPIVAPIREGSPASNRGSTNYI